MNVGAFGNRAIVLLRPAILHRYSVAKVVGWLPSSLSGLDDARLPVTEPAKSTVEQIAVDPSMLNTARTTAREKRNSLLSRLFPTPFQRQKSGFSNRRARVIRIRQKIIEQKNLLADGLAASSRGKSI